MNTYETPAFFAIIPSTIRYDMSIPDGSKLLYAEITALCKSEGYCRAGDAYFAKLYQCSERNIQRWISKLNEKKHIVIKYETNSFNNVKVRHLYLPEVVTKNTPPNPPPAPKEEPTPQKTRAVPDSRSDKNVTPHGQKCREGVTFLSQTGDKNVARQVILQDNINTAAAPPDKNEPPPDDSPPDAAAAAAAAAEVVNLKSTLAALDKRLIFDDNDFYNKALRFMRDNALDHGYPQYIYDYCANKTPKSMSGFFHTLFFAANHAAFYADNHKPAAPPKPARYPVYASTHPPGQDCPSCGLPANHSTLDIAVFALPTDKKLAYLSRKDTLLNNSKKPNGHLNLQAFIIALKALNEEFDLC